MKKKVVISIFTLIAIVGMVGGYIYYKNNLQYKENPSGLSGYILGEGVEPGLSEEEIMELMKKQMDESKVTFSINSEPVFKGKKGNIVFANPRYSAHDIAVTVDVGGKTVIKTDKISPNQYIQEIELIGRPLPKGKHKGDAMITAYKRDTGEVVGKVAVQLDITSE